MKLSMTILASVAIGFVFAGCEKRVDIEVFIVTKGAENFKLGLVDVAAFQKETVTESLRSYLLQRDEKVRQLQAAIRDNEEKLKRLEPELKKAQNLSSLAYHAIGRAEKARDAAAKDLYRAIIAADKRSSIYLQEVRQKIKDEEVFNRFKANVDSDREKIFSGHLAITLHVAETMGPEYPLQSVDLSILRDKIEAFREVFTHELWGGMPAERDAAQKAIEGFVRAENFLIKADTEHKAAGLSLANVGTTVISPIEDDLDNLRVEVLEALKASAILDKLQKPTLRAKTNADGKCSLQLPSGKWIVAASAQRKVADTTERYLWLVEIPNDAGSGKTLILSNDNLLEDGVTPVWVRESLR